MSLLVMLLAWSCLASACALALGALAEVHHAFLLWRSRRVTASSLAHETGIVDVRGHVKTDHPLMAPLTGRNCVQFAVIMERKPPAPGVSRDGDPDLITFVGAAPFSVDDGTGRVVVDLRVRRVPVTGTDVVRQQLERLTKPLEKMLHQKLGKPGGLWCMKRDVVATEAALLEGTDVSVIARVRNGIVEPVHVTTARAKVVAMRGLIRAAGAVGGAAFLGALFAWLR